MTDDIFSCKSLEQIDVLFGSVTSSLSRTDVSEGIQFELTRDTVSADGLVFHANEELTLERLSKSVTTGTHDILLWPCDYPQGPSFLAYCLALRLLSNDRIDRVYIIRPFSKSNKMLPDNENSTAKQPFEQALTSLARRLELPRVTGRVAKEILDRLVATRSLLIILNADMISESEPARYSTIHDLIRTATGLRRTCKAYAPLVLVGDSSYRPDLNSIKSAAGAADPLPIRRGERFTFFQVQWKRFCECRGTIVSDDLGFRLKRARWYYETVNEYDVFPINIRLRPFFASNYQMQSYFDPTAGWQRLAGMPRDELPRDINLYLEDILYQLQQMPNKGKRLLELRALRWCSTALYWLTEPAAAELGKAVTTEDIMGRTGTVEPQTSLGAFQSSVSKITGLVRKTIRQIPIDSQTPTNIQDLGMDYVAYVTSIAVKAVVQDQWMARDPLSRSVAHYRVARGLYELRDDKEFLTYEYPFEPHWGRSRFHFMAECLRHLIRACEAVKPFKSTREYVQFPADLPKEPRGDIGGCDPHEVVNFCFGELYWRQLNGNRRDGRILNRKLARQHGAYQLSLELLQLMSKNGRLGDPHWALHKDHVPLYLKEVAFAQMDLGSLADAEHNFLELIKALDFQSGIQEPPHARRRQELLNARLDLALVLATRQRTQQAAVLLDIVAEELGVIRAEEVARQRDLAEASAERHCGSPWLGADGPLVKLERRVQARKGHLMYLSGQFEEARQLYETYPSGEGRGC